MRVALPAVLIGAVASWYVSHLWQEQFSEKAVLSPLLFIGCALLVLAVIMGVVCIGCRRVTTSNPVNYLKTE
jgi:putative ABC transport system permease protein